MGGRNILRIIHLGAEISIKPARRSSDQPKFVREFDKEMMRWYRSLGQHRKIRAGDLVRLFPTFVARVGYYTLVIQSGGGKHPNSFSLDVFNKRGVVVDSVIYCDGGPLEKFPKKWPHGARVVDARRAMRFVPRSPRHPRLILPQ